MSACRCITALAAAATLAATAAPDAGAFAAGAPAGPSIIPAARPTHQGTGGTPDWLVGAGAAAGVLVLGGSLAAKRRRTHTVGRSSQTTTARAPARTP